MIIAGVTLGFVSSEPGVNTMGSCSAPIRAAYHPRVAHELDRYQLS